MSATGSHPNRAFDPNRQVGPEGAGFTENPHPVGSRAHKRWNEAQAQREIAAAAPPEPRRMIVSDTKRMGETPRFNMGPGTSPDVYDPETLDVDNSYHARKLGNLMRPGRGAGA